LKTAKENEVDWILEVFLSIVDLMDSDAKQVIRNYAELQLDAKKKSTYKRAKKVLKKMEEK